MSKMGVREGESTLSLSLSLGLVVAASVMVAMKEFTVGSAHCRWLLTVNGQTDPVGFLLGSEKKGKGKSDNGAPVAAGSGG